MPFKSKKQRRWMHANKPEMAKKWEKYKEGGQVDNILARLTEGEFVIKKSSAQKLGYDALEHMNSYGEIPTNDARKRSKK
jgi:hypothetical protein